MNKLIIFIAALNFVAISAMEAQNQMYAKGLNTPAKPAKVNLKNIPKQFVPVPPLAPKIHGPVRPGSGHEILDSAYNWVSNSFLPVWGSPETRFKNYVYNSNYNITAYEKDTLNGTSWVNESRYFYTFNSSDSIATYVVQNWSGSAWVNYDSSNYSYNTSGQILSRLDEDWSGSAWVNNDLYTNTYNSAGFPTLQEYQTWVSSAWSDTWQYIYTYNTNNQELTYEYDLGSGSTWTPDWLYTYVYNSGGYQILDEYQTWSGSWMNSSETITSYNSSNQEDSVLDLTGSGSTWTNQYLYTFIYNTYNQNTSYLFQAWTSGVWVNQWLYTYTYASTSSPNSEPATVLYEYGVPFTNLDDEIFTYNNWGGDSTEIYLTWSGSAWDSSSRYYWIYNSNNLVTSELIQSYVSSAWVNNSQTLTTYNSYNQQTLVLSQNWNSGAWTNYYEDVTVYNSNDYEIFYEYQTVLGGGAWAPQQYNTWEYNADNFLQAYSNAADESRNDSTQYYFNSASGIKPISDGNNMLIYPNPSPGTFTIQSSVVSGNLSVEVYSMLGEKVYQTQIPDFNSTADIAMEAPSGVYFIRVMSEKQGAVLNEKIVVQR